MKATRFTKRGPWMVTDKEGQWVKHAEYQKLHEQFTLLLDEVNAGRSCWKICNHEYTVLSEDVEKLAKARAKVDEAGILDTNTAKEPKDPHAKD